jgi:hypothetical protein
MIDLAHGFASFPDEFEGLPAPRINCKQGEKMRGRPAMMQPPDWNDYHAFLAIARAGQLARAAQDAARFTRPAGYREIPAPAPGAPPR